MGKAWNIVQAWVDSQPLDTTDAALSRALGVAQSNFDIWKNPKKLPSHEAMGAIAELTGRPYREVLDAFIEDIGYAEPPSKERMAARRRKREPGDQ